MTFPASIRTRSGESKTTPAGAEAGRAGAIRRGPDPGGHAEGLNAQQADAVLLDHDADGPALVLAGAGSGKTTVLARRIARQALLDGDASRILALTFTKEAAEEMGERVAALLERSAGPAGPGRALGRPLGRPYFGTFHAFAFGLLRSEAAGLPNWRRLGFAREPGLLEPAARDAWLAGPGAADSEGLPASPAERAALLADAFSEGREGEAAPEAARLRARWRDHLLASGRLAFDDMVSLAIRLLREHPHALSDARKRFRRILVDEFQDTSPDQLELVRLLLGGRPGLFLVGDDDQAIYGFRGADPGNIAKALEMFPGLRILKLEVNYRSTPPIVAYANGIFRGKPAHLRKSLRAGRATLPGKAPAPVRTAVHGTGAGQGRWMAEEMARLVREEGLAWEGIAVLYRLNALEPYYRSLVRTLLGPEAESRVVFATVHASKGLQWPAVFLVGLEDGVLPYRRRGAAADSGSLAEERRIFYVGVTRAERFLYLCACRSRVQRGSPRALTPSPFLAGAGDGVAALGAPGEGGAGGAGSRLGGLVRMAARLFRPAAIGAGPQVPPGGRRKDAG